MDLFTTVFRFIVHTASSTFALASIISGGGADGVDAGNDNEITGEDEEGEHDGCRGGEVVSRGRSSLQEAQQRVQDLGAADGDKEREPGRVRQGSHCRGATADE